jgi:hypothetical protein
LNIQIQEQNERKTIFCFMRGELFKQGEVLHQWNTRSFLFDAESLLLLYWSNNLNNRPRGAIALDANTEIADKPQSGKYHVFAIQRPGRVEIVLAAESKDLVENWKNVLKCAIVIENLIEFLEFLTCAFF